MKKTLRDNLHEHVAACFTGLWIQSAEHDDALAEIGALCDSQRWGLLVWASNAVCMDQVVSMNRPTKVIRWRQFGR